MIHVSNILVPVDPAASNPALLQALHWAHRLNAVVHAVEVHIAGGDSLPPSTKARSSDVVDRMARECMRRLKLPPGTGLRAMHQDASSLVQGITQYATDHSIDLMVAAPSSCEFTNLARRTPLPMHIVGPSIPSAPPLRRILAPIDFSRHAQRALAHAKLLSALFDASLRVLHVLERPPFVALNPTDMLALSDAKLPERRALQKIKALFDSATGPSVDATFHVAHGDPAREITVFANKHSSDLLVLSSHGSTGQSRHPLGTVADKLVHQLDASIFLIKSFGVSLVPLSSNSLPSNR